MKENTKYKVVYNDGEKVKVREMAYLRKEDPFLVFNNEVVGKETLIHWDNIIRMEVV